MLLRSELPVTTTRQQRIVAELLEECGVAVNGGQDHDITVHHDSFYGRVLRGGSLALGESYMDGLWDCKRIDEFITRLLTERIQQRVGRSAWEIALDIGSVALNLQNHVRSLMVGKQHYDVGNELYESMLDSYMNYSCGYWDDAADLEQAQRNKLELICRKLELKPGMKVLDIGCGWGGVAKYAAENFDVQVTGITISQKQKELAEARCQGLPVDIKFEDYRDTQGQFDRIVSVGMFEHVGYKNYRRFFQKCSELLHPGGLLLLHTIGSNRTMTRGDPWLSKYIFPNGMLPSVAQIGEAVEKYFMMEDWHNFGPDYARTLAAWYENVNKAWPRLEKQYSERFKRMWDYYLLCCVAMFRSRHGQLWQVVFSKRPRTQIYHRPVLG
ncbi:MAG: cyclopropane fatty acyl phospholipid synthase [Gammaproteobacteria bacterium]